mmetsp:Transcript_19226/g.53572  ORF Transcript_19226/g.53572 Transcript_19226/m.53572 type:complete len:212 (+) Transcript_19226:217-852(+)
MVRSALIRQGMLRCRTSGVPRASSSMAGATIGDGGSAHSRRSFHRFDCRSNPWTAGAQPMTENNATALPKPTRRFFSVGFANESEYHSVADETLEEIQDAVEMAIEDHCDEIIASNTTESEEEPEVVFASGVLTLTLPPHGTWVLNKQTPNQQIWWSSPLSGPRRYEYDGEEWVYTRAGEGGGPSGDGALDTLKGAIQTEFGGVYGIELDL